MTLLVPFDGTALSAAALDRAAEFARATDEGLVVLTVVPDDEAYARDRGWIDAEEAFDPEAIAADFEAEAREHVPEATFRHERTIGVDSRASVTTDVVRTIRQVATEIDASILFVGSEHAGRVSTPDTSVGDPIAEDPRYDVHIVRHPE